MIKNMGMLCLAVLSAISLRAQNTDARINYGFGGSVLNRDMLWASDFAELSRTHLFGTARVMGMGGAFTSLGADLSSMALNPAGLGMYRSNEFSFTPRVARLDRRYGLVAEQQQDAFRLR